MPESDAEHMTTRRDNTFYPNGLRLIAANVTPTVSPLDRFLALQNSSDAAAKAIVVSGVKDGQEFSAQLFARSSTGTYTVACSNLAAAAGTVTLDAAGEGADFYKDDGVLYVTRLIGTATFA